MKRLGLLIALLSVALVLVGCNGEDAVTCPTSGTFVSPGTSTGTAYSISLGATYQASIGSYGDSDYYKFVASSTGNYTGCVGTATRTDLGFRLLDSGGGFIAECDEWWEDESTHERCSTSAGGFPLSGGSTYYIVVDVWGGVNNAGTYGVTVTKD